MKKEMICIICPQGCRLKVTQDDVTKEITVENSGCKRGPVYARKELTNPTRIITATVPIKNGIHRRLPVKTSKDVPKKMNFKIMESLKNLEVSAPIRRGQVIIKNILGTGADIIATRSMEQIKP